MKRLKTPQEKKKLSYENEYPTQAEYPHAFRKQWPKKELIAQREFRRKVNQILNNKIKAAVVDENLDPEIKQIRRRVVRKWSSKPLKEIVPHKLNKRVRRFAWNYFKVTYSKELDFERFSNLVNTLIEGKTETSYLIATQFDLWLKHPTSKEYLWLHSFFKDAPDLKKKLLAWIATISISK